MAPNKSGAAAVAKRGAELANGSANKKPKVQAANTPAQPSTSELCSSVCQALEAADELPERCRQMLVAVVACTLAVESRKRHDYQRSAVDLLRSAVNSLESGMERTIERAESSMRKHSSEREELNEMQRSTEDRLAKNEEAMTEKAAVEAEGMAAIKSARTKLAKAEMARARVVAQVQQIEAKKEPWEKAMSSHLEPIKVGCDCPAAVKRHISALLPLCKKLNVEDSFLQVLPTAANKTPSARGNFDAMVIMQLGKFFTSHVATISLEIEKLQPLVSDRDAEMSAATEQETASREAIKQAADAIAAIADERSQLEAESRDIKRKLKECGASIKEVEAARTTARSRLAEFQLGPLEAFQTLDDREQKASGVEVVICAGEAGGA